MANKKITPVKKSNPLTLDYGKIPPQALDLEEAVLGAIMLEKDAILSVLDILIPDSFYKEAHQKIYEVAYDLSHQEKPIDLLTIIEELRKRGTLDEVGGASYITQLTSRIGSAAHLEYHARIVAQKFIQRELIKVSSEIQQKAFDESIDVDDLLDFSERELLNISEGHIKKETVKINRLIAEAIHQIEEAGKREDNLSGVPSGFTRLDRLTSGWQKSDLIIIAARPSMGKTALVLSMARNIAVDHKRPIAFFSLEMSSIQLVNRLIIGETQLPSDKLRNGRLQNYEWEQLEYKIKDLEQAPIYIDDTPAISIFEFRAKCRRLKQKYDIQAVVIDYLQLMTGPRENTGSREQEVSNISRSLKSVAKELDIPIIALSQLNRSVEMRSGNKRPQLSDLRESGAIEQDADLVIFIHRPEYYGLDTDEEGNSLKGIAEIILAKHRNGPVGELQLKFIREYAKFIDMEGGIDYIQDENGNSLVKFQSRLNAEGDSGKLSNEDLGLSGGFDEAPPF
ncbi:MAG: replicative DNA helicase [Bacteroidales bacterium]|nr:replicative DNA helicase [Bacteroidales bacterium]MBN2698196.1 replicative DNA helicase [Bacteroidales bacterium]